MAKAILPIINPETGEVLKETAPLKDLSECRKVIAMKVKVLETQLDEIDDILAPILEQKLEDGENKLCDYWSIIRGRNTFNKAIFEEKALKSTQDRYTKLKSEIREIESDDMYKTTGKPTLRFPKI